MQSIGTSNESLTSCFGFPLFFFFVLSASLLHRWLTRSDRLRSLATVGSSSQTSIPTEFLHTEPQCARLYPNSSSSTLVNMVMYYRIIIYKIDQFAHICPPVHHPNPLSLHLSCFLAFSISHPFFSLINPLMQTLYLVPAPKPFFGRGGGCFCATATATI